MILRASASEINDFLKLPETGMGYQVAKFKLGYFSEPEKFVIYNSELIVKDDWEFDSIKRKIINEGYTKVFSNAGRNTDNIYNIKMMSRYDITDFSRKVSNEEINDYKRHSGGKAAIDSPSEYASGEEVFVRLSAYANDRRVDEVNKRFLDGTFATTLRDYNDCVSTKDDPIDRYALPNNETIKWAFYNRPKSFDKLQRGIVQPANNHDGGGIEVYFADGTSNNTLYDKRAYGK